MSSTAQQHSFRRWAVLALAISFVVGVVQYAVGYVVSLDPPFLLALPVWLLGFVGLPGAIVHLVARRSSH